MFAGRCRLASGKPELRTNNLQYLFDLMGIYNSRCAFYYVLLQWFRRSLLGATRQGRPTFTSLIHFSESLAAGPSELVGR